MQTVEDGSERSIQWAVAQVRGSTSDPDLIETAAMLIRQAVADGRVWIEPELGQFVQELISGTDAAVQNSCNSELDSDPWVRVVSWISKNDKRVVVAGLKLSILIDNAFN